MSLARWITVMGTAAFACATTVVTATASHDPSAASHAPTPRAPMVSASDSQPGYAIEDFSYPGAAKIKETKGIALKRGDGHIVLAECGSSPGLMEVWSRRTGKTCFRVTASSGYLSLEIPAVYLVKGSASRTADVVLTAADGKRQEVRVPADRWTSVGESTDPKAHEHSLIEIGVGRNGSAA
ncbi:hypothetical protein ACFP1Z_31545 [Streptomyces gamaensis]|uniref:Secreted protein n=1 Tax=Streptomyces gamaensis TaxID=1763542 RepID=A0ABW0ZEE0_9ACTN